MDIKRIHEMIEKLTECAKSELDKGIEQVDTEEMAKVICMIKDLADAQYHRSVVVAMEEGSEGEEYEDMRMDDERRYYDNYRYRNGRFAPKGRGTYRPRRGYDEPMYYGGSEPDYRMSPEMYRKHENQPEWYRDMDRNMGRMYYTEPSDTQNMNGNTSGGRRMYDEGTNMRDGREGRSGTSRRSYMETKEMHKANTAQDKEAKMKELENYAKELSTDITDMISDATQEEKMLLKNKLSVLVQKI